MIDTKTNGSKTKAISKRLAFIRGQSYFSTSSPQIKLSSHEEAARARSCSLGRREREGGASLERGLSKAIGSTEELAKSVEGLKHASSENLSEWREKEKERRKGNYWAKKAFKKVRSEERKSDEQVQEELGKSKKEAKAIVNEFALDVFLQERDVLSRARRLRKLGKSSFDEKKSEEERVSLWRQIWRYDSEAEDSYSSGFNDGSSMTGSRDEGDTFGSSMAGSQVEGDSFCGSSMTESRDEEDSFGSDYGNSSD